MNEEIEAVKMMKCKKKRILLKKITWLLKGKDMNYKIYNDGNKTRKEEKMEI